MRQTSIDAYRSLENVSQKQMAVFEALDKLGTACNLDIAYELKWSINRVTPRMNELVKKRLVVESHRGISKRTGRRVIYWKINKE